MLEIRDLHVKFHTRQREAVAGVSLTIHNGEILGLVGESGSGKSVTAMSVAGLLPRKQCDFSGEILLDGAELLHADRTLLRQVQGREIGVVFQEPQSCMDPLMRIGPQVEEVLRIHTDLSREARRDQALAALAAVELPDPAGVYRKYPHELSGGMLQRAMIAAAVVARPKLLLLDEPTTALDVTIQAQVLELMNELKEKLRTSLLLITHDLGVVAQVCDRVAIMYAGEIVESGTIAEVFDHPHHPYTIGLFGSIPSLDETAEKLKPIQGQMPDPTELPEGCAFAPRCPYATGACRTRKPEMTGVGGTQMVRCLAHQGVFESPKLMEEVRHGR
mgnify:CR=1 FL=1